MKKKELERTISKLLDKFHSFSFSLIPDELQAQQLVIDAYSVFLVREIKFLEGLDLEEKRDRVIATKYIFSTILSDIFDLAVKRSSHVRHILNEDHGEFNSFFQLEMTKRALLFLNIKFNLAPKEIQKIINLKKFQIIEGIYNAKDEVYQIKDQLNG